MSKGKAPWNEPGTIDPETARARLGLTVEQFADWQKSPHWNLTRPRCNGLYTEKQLTLFARAIAGDDLQLLEMIWEGF